MRVVDATVSGSFQQVDLNVAMDLADTVLARRSREEVDLLATPSQLRGWLDAESDRLPTEGADTAARLGKFRALRDAVREAFSAAVAGEPLPSQAVESLNDASAAASVFLSLESDGRIHETASASDATAAILAAIARSAIWTLGGPDRERLRVCGAPGCGRFFLAARAAQSWCTSACGNRARVARHYLKMRSRTAG